MPEVHLPKLEAHDGGAGSTPGHSRRKSIATILLEVVLISGGVFLGIAGEQWRENVHHRELAMTSLQRLRAEVATNQTMVTKVKDYHLTLSGEIKKYLAADTPEAKKRGTVHVNGIQPVAFEHTAWDVALATQALEYIDPDLVFDLSRIYNDQQGYLELTRSVLQAMYIEPPSENIDKFLRALDIYLGDITLTEPNLLKAYDDVLPKIDVTLAGTPSK